MYNNKQQQQQQQQQPLIRTIPFVDELATLTNLGEKLMWSLFFFAKEENKFAHRTLKISGKEDTEVLQRLESIVKFVSVHVSSFLSRFTTESPNGDRLYVDFLRLLTILRDIDIIITNNTQFFIDFIAGFSNECDAQSPKTPKVPTVKRSGSISSTQSSAIVVPSASVAERRDSMPLWHGSPTFGPTSVASTSPGMSAKNPKLTGSLEDLGSTPPARHRSSFPSRISMRFTGKPNLSSGSSSNLTFSALAQHSPMYNANPIAIKRTGNFTPTPSVSHDYADIIEWFGFSECGCGPCLTYLKRSMDPQPSFWNEVVEYALRLVTTTESELFLLLSERNVLIRGMAVCFYFADVPALLSLGTTTTNNNNNSSGSSGSGCYHSDDSTNSYGSSGDAPHSPTIDSAPAGSGSSNSSGGGSSSSGNGGFPGDIDPTDFSCREDTKRLFERSVAWFKRYPFFPVCDGGYADCIPATLLAGLPNLSALISVSIPEQVAAVNKAAAAKLKDVSKDDFASVEAAVASIPAKITNTQSVVSHVMKMFDGLNNLMGCSNALSGVLLSGSFTNDSRLLEKTEAVNGPRRWESLYPTDVTATVLHLIMYIKEFQSRAVRIPRDIARNALATLYEEIATVAGRSPEYTARLRALGLDLAPATFTLSNARMAVFALVEGIAAAPGAPYASDLAVRHIKHLYGLARFFDTFNDYAYLAILWIVDANPIPSVKPAQLVSPGGNPIPIPTKNTSVTQRVHNRLSVTQKPSMTSPPVQPAQFYLDPAPVQVAPAPSVWGSLSATTPSPRAAMTAPSGMGATTTATAMGMTGGYMAPMGAPGSSSSTSSSSLSPPGTPGALAPSILNLMRPSPNDTVLGIGPGQKEHLARVSSFYGDFPGLSWAEENVDCAYGADEFFVGCRYITYTYKVLSREILDGIFVSSQLVLIDYVYSDARLVYTRHCPRLCTVLDSEYRRKPQGLCHELARGFVDVSVKLLTSVMPLDTLEDAVEFLLGCADVVPVTLSVALQDVLDMVGRERVIQHIAAMTSYKITMLAEHAEQTVTEEEVVQSVGNFIRHQISYKMVLEFTGAPKGLVTLETPISVFSKLGKTGIAKRLFWMMFASHIYADVLPVDETASKALVALIREIVTADPVTVHVRDRAQNTLLHWAARMPLAPGYLEELLSFLAENGSDIEARNSEGATPLLAAATPAAALALAGFGACLNAARIDGRGIADLHPDWVPAIQQALGIQALPALESVVVLNVMVAAPDIPPPATTPTIVIGGGNSSKLNLSSSGTGNPTIDGEGTKEKDKNKQSVPEEATKETPSEQAPLALRFTVMSMIPVPYGSLFSAKTPVFPWLKPGSGEKYGKECWPLVPMGDVEGSVSGKNTLVRVCVGDMAAPELVAECPVLLALYDVGNADSLDSEQIQESISASQAISRFLIGVGSEVRSDKAAIAKYWEQRALPVRLEDAVHVGRLLRLHGFSECQATCSDMYNVLYAAVHFYAARFYYKSSAAGVATAGNSGSNKGGESTEEQKRAEMNQRIKPLIPMQRGDACYDSVKMLVLGHEEAGKTSLLDSISEKHSWKAFSKAIWKKRSSQTMSTIGIKRVPLTIGEVPVNAYDFGGQLEYHAIHEYFLSPYCAMYLVVVDGSKERLTEQLGYWLQLLHSHSNGPRGSCALIVACTKEDVIEKRFDADAVAAKRAFLKDYLSRWPSLRKIAAADVFMVSNKTGYGIKALQDAIKERLRVLAKTPVPQLYLSAAQVFARSVSLFMNFKEFVKFMVDNKILTQKMPPKHSHQLARDILDFLHNSGHAVVSGGYDTICCRPELMSNVLSIFVAPPDHLKRLLRAEGIQRMDIHTHSELVRRFNYLDEVKGAEAGADKLCDRIISALEDMKFCYTMRPEEARLAYNLAPINEQCYIFPSLCDAVDLVALPYNETADRCPEILRVGCHGYECAACRSRYPAGEHMAPPAGGVCPRCGCGDLVHVCLNEPLGPVATFSGRHHPEMYIEYLTVLEKGTTDYAWACLANSEGTGQVVSLPRTCPCVERVAPAVKYVACIVNSMLEQGVSASEFNRVAVQLRRYMHPRYRLFRNFVVFRDMYGNVVLATLFTKDRQCALGIISRGTVPHLWAESLHPLLTLGEAVAPACPACAHFNTFTPLHPAPAEGPNAIPGAAEAGIMVCESGHIVSSDQVNMGMQRDERLCAESALWGPKKSAAFYKESAGLWTSDPRYPNATFTELTSVELTPARQSEYIFARSLFYKFVGTDPASSQFTLTKVVFVENKATEALFARKFGEFAARAYSSAQIDPAAAAAAAAAAAKKPSADRVAWQQWVLGHLEKCIERVCGNEQINLVGGWHGTIDRSAHGIANTNFYTPAENKASKDPGYFGKGVYFTQSPSYGVDYAVLSANITKQHAKEGRMSYNEEELAPCLIFSWILLGRVYPVTEAASLGNPDSLMGKGCVEGYDSHYVVLPQQTRGAKAEAITKPYNPSSLLEKPGCDEIVVFDKAQILPRYIFYYESNAKSAGAKDGFLPLEVRDAKTVILWVDDEISAHYMIVIQTYIKKVVPDVAIVSMVSSSELKAWLHQFGQEVEDKIMVITNFFRANDGENNAAWRVINEVRKVAKLKKVPILVFKKKRTDQIEYFSKLKLVYTAFDDAGLLSFIQQKKT